MEHDADVPPAQVLMRKRKTIPKKKKCQPQSNEPIGAAHGLNPSPLLAAAPYPRIDASPEILVSEFDCSVENHFNYVDTVVKLGGHPDTVDSNQAEVERFSNSITFLREWKDFNYAPRTVRFACQYNSEGKDMMGEVTLPQFSASAVPKVQNPQIGSKVTSTKSCKDFIMYVGGSVWALDWCPRADCSSDKYIPEFVAVAAHPPESSYHKIGAPLTGRGAIQIWCMLTVCEEEDVSAQCNKKRKPTPRKGAVMANGPIKPKMPRGRPRKKPLNETSENVYIQNQFVQPLAIEYPKESSESQSTDMVNNEQLSEYYDKRNQGCNQIEYANSLVLTIPKGQGNQRKVRRHNNDLQVLIQDEHQESFSVNPLSSPGCCIDSLGPPKKINCIGSCNADTSKNFVPESFALPRLMFCLAHNGKVAWDVKWRPINAFSSKCLKHMGYLAVILGNGALEVWEVPHPRTVKHVYPSCEKHVDPRFIKLQPVFRCSILKCGDRQSIPLTVEWSVSSPHDMILAGCHDGVVALWKFSMTDPSTETRPLLSFSADTGPIRTLAWAPNQGDFESANVIVTAGHRGFKFWDIRDPFRPLWEHPIQGVPYSLEWLPDPRCIYGSIDDGTLWLLNLVKTPSDIPVSGKPHTGSKTGIHNFDCSPFCLWSIHASRLTGMVAYCGEEGTAFCFQPTTRSVKDPSRHRLHHYLCGSLLEEESELIVVSPSTSTAFVKKSPGLKRGVLSAKNQEEKTERPEGQSYEKPQEICYENNLVDELGCDDPSMAIQKQALKSKLSGKNNLESGQETSFRDKVRKPNMEATIEEKTEKIKVFPPKIVAMHRVRWNLNKDSKKWLCYGGASGLLRCQEVDISAYE